MGIFWTQEGEDRVIVWYNGWDNDTLVSEMENIIIGNQNKKKERAEELLNIEKDDDELLENDDQFDTTVASNILELKY